MADPRAIHEFTTGEVEATTLLLGDFVDLDAQSGYTTLKMSVSDLGEVLLEDIEYTQDLDTTDKTIVGAINEINGKTIKKGTVTGTTSANGIFQMDITPQNINIISAIACKGDTICGFYPAYAVDYQGVPQGAWYFNIVSSLSGHAPIANEQVTIIYFYIEY